MEMCYTPLLPHHHLRADDDIHRACVIVTCLVSDELTFRKFTEQKLLGTLITQEATIKWPGKLESERFRIVFKSSCEVLLHVKGNYCVPSSILELPNRHGENSV